MLPGYAQNPPTASSPAADPAALPGDTPMPSLDFQLHKDLGPPAGTPAQSHSVVGTPRPALDLALEAAHAAIEACRADGYRIGVAVTDSAGQLLVGLAADGAGPGRVYVAIRKDIAAATFKMPTLALRAKLLADPALRAQIKPNMSVFSGAVPLMVRDRVVGAIASSGSTGNEDDACANIGAEKIQSRLK
jgi:uncharacterized protein GlcG (DUF336 family)